MRRVTCITILVVVCACESEDERLERLETDKVTACLRAERFYDRYRSRTDSSDEMRDSLGEEWQAEKRKCDLATRELNRFMR
jgi:hypothetical protein